MKQKKESFTLEPIKTMSKFSTHVRLKIKDMNENQKKQALTFFIPPGGDINKCEFDFLANTGKIDRVYVH